MVWTGEDPQVSLFKLETRLSQTAVLGEDRSLLQARKVCLTLVLVVVLGYSDLTVLFLRGVRAVKEYTHCTKFISTAVLPY